MRMPLLPTAAVITLACTSGAAAQWCDPANPGISWCGARGTYESTTYVYSRARDVCTAIFSFRWSNLRYYNDEVAADIFGTGLAWTFELPARGCTGMTDVEWHSPYDCAVYTVFPGGVYCTNFNANCATSGWRPIYHAPPACPGRFWLSYEACADQPGSKHAVLKTSSDWQHSNYAVHVERMVVAAQGAGSERLGSTSTIDLGGNDSSALGTCASENGYTKAVYKIRETCNGYLYNSSVMLVNEWNGQALGGPPSTTVIPYSTLRNAISTRLSARGTFRVRTPSAVLGHRGYKAHETVLNGYLEDPASQVRWQRVLDDAFPEDGILPIETLEDGPLVGGSSVTGTHEPTLRLSGFTEHDVGTYLMRTIPPGGTIDDSEVVTTIRVVEDVGQPVFAEQPQGKTVSPALFANGGTVSFAAPAVASSNDPDDPIIYQWFVNGQMPWYDWAGSEHGDAILVGPYWNAATSGPTLTISSFQPGAGSDIHNVVFWLECEAMNSHGSTRTRPIPFVIDIDTDDCDGNGITDAAELAAGAIDANGDGIPDGCQCLPDLNSDGMVDGGDLGRLLSHWGPTQPNADSERCDLNADGRIDGADLGVMLSGWGACGG